MNRFLLVAALMVFASDTMAQGIFALPPVGPSGPALYNGATLTASAGNPSATTSTTGVMMGVGSTCKITPLISTRLHLEIYGFISNSTASDGAVPLLKFGTGSAPANGAAPAGSTIGNGPAVINNASTAGLSVPFKVGGIATGLTPGTQYWLDVDLSVLTGGTATVFNLACVAYEF